MPDEITLHVGDTVQFNVQLLKRDDWQVGQHLELKLITIIEQQDGTLALVLGHDGDS